MTGLFDLDKSVSFFFNSDSNSANSSSIKIHKTNKNVYEHNLNKLNLIKNINDPIESLFNNTSRPDENSLKKLVLDEIKYKRIGGVRLEAAGRLTKRNVAARSIKKLTYIGTLKNIDSSYRGMSVVTLRGHLKPNLTKTIFNSKAKTGAFSVKA